ncbi:expressed unknown protein [Seminavis robusta]|uniref:Uncharacterized protein n=1 Tax=Seminavis robusta TaxID=568900 RepID=A0A9N8EFU6_9STRA|nr:expressed unknown protein [Seminavis robusta]|eukprot:Sro1032_g233600.1 n/a (253) ;mRNA; r:30232-30990
MTSANNNRINYPLSSSSSEILQQVAGLNDQGICQLMVHDTRIALSYFTKALTILQQEISKAQEDAVSNEDWMQSPICLSASIPGLLNEQADESGGLFVHSKAFSLQIIGNDISSVPGTQHLAAMAILFNIALTYHLHGAKHQQMACVEKAFRFYQVCSGEIISSSAVIIDPTSCLFVSLACRNNQAQIQYHYLGNKAMAAQLACQLQQQLKLFAVVTTDACKDNNNVVQLIDEMLLNVHMLIRARSMAASAA